MSGSTRSGPRTTSCIRPSPGAGSALKTPGRSSAARRGDRASALEGGTASHHGRYFATEGFQLLPRPDDLPRPSLMIGSDGPKTLRLTLPHVESWNWDGFVDDPEEFAAASRGVDAVCDEIGRDPRDVQRTAHLVVRLSNPEGLPIDPLPAHLRVIEGETDAVAARLQTFADAGAHEVMLIVDPARPAAIEELARAVEGMREAG